LCTDQYRIDRKPSDFCGLGCNQLDRGTARGDGFYDVDNSLTDPYIRLDQWQVINTTTWTASELLTLKNIASYGEFTEHSRFNLNGDNLITSTSPLFTGAGFPIHFAAVSPGPSGDTSHQSTFTEELQLQGRTADDKLVYQLGGYFEQSTPLGRSTQSTDTFMDCIDVSNFQCNSPNVPANRGRVSTTDLTFKFRGWGVYAQATYKITDKFSVTGGIRYTDDSILGTAQSAYALYLTPNNPTFACTKIFSAPGVNLALPSLAVRTACYEEVTQKSGRPTWLLDLDYKPTEDVLLYAKYARGYRQGSVNLIPSGVAF
jgi:iron complex outermembrane receptor protein